MRFDTHRISAFLVQELQKARPLLEVTDDSGDLIRVRLASGETVFIYLIESPITVYEIKGIVTANTAAGIYSLFILWSELFLPVTGSRYRPNDWMATLLAVGQDKIYGFDPYGGDNLIYPVYFEGSGVERSIHHGKPVNVSNLNCFRVETHSSYISGIWRMADFEPRTGQTQQRRLDPLHAYYDVLGIQHEASRDKVKRAYRRLARKYHPDINQTPEATLRMQEINDAYEKIMRELSKRRHHKGG
jgi:hypothetical protein